jgi:hypothetical protein
MPYFYDDGTEFDPKMLPMSALMTGSKCDMIKEI